MTAPSRGASWLSNGQIRVAVLGLTLSACGGTTVTTDAANPDHGDAAAGKTGAASGGATASAGASAAGGGFGGPGRTNGGAGTLTGGGGTFVGGSSSGTGAGGSLQAGMGGGFVLGGPTPGCNGAPDPGTCSDKVARFYYDASSSSCRPFTYTGCGGNENNFQTLAGCQSYCVNGRSCSCSGTQTTCTVNRECSDCPANLDTAGETSCTMDGLRCFGANGAMCSCAADTGGTAWICGRKAL